MKRWIFMIAGLLIMVVVIIMGARYVSTQNGTKATELGTNSETGSPSMTFETDSYDFGRVIEGETVSYGFKFTNTGSSDLVISNVQTSCGCTVPVYPKTAIKPGESEKIVVKFESMGKRGFQNKTITLLTNATPDTQLLRIKAQVIIPSEVNK